MSTIVTRTGKGAALTWAEADANFTNLNTDKAELASPTFTGTPAAPTAAVGTNTTQVATTAYTKAEIASDRPYSDTNPIMDSTAAQGSSPKVSRQDHVHPSDTTKVNKAGDTMTGALKNTASQIGTSATATNNFSLEPTTTGAMKLARGVAGATTSDIMTIDSNDIVTFPSGAYPGDNVPFMKVGLGGSTYLAMTIGSLTTVLFDSQPQDVLDCYDATTGRFTPKKAGWYNLHTCLWIGCNGVPTEMSMYLMRNGTNIAMASGPLYLNVFMNMSAFQYFNGTTDYATVGVKVSGSSSAYVNTDPAVHFSAFRIK